MFEKRSQRVLLVREGRLKNIGRYELLVHAIRKGITLDVLEADPDDLNPAEFARLKINTIVCDGCFAYNNDPVKILFGNLLNDLVISQ